MKALLPSPSVFWLILTLTATFCRAAYVPERVSIQIEVTLQKDPPSISLQWEHTPVAELASSIPTKQFYVYRSSTSIEGPFTRITDNIVSEATFTDSSAVNGNNYYMVRAIQLTETPATTFYNPSQAAFFSTNFVAPPQSPSQSDSPKPIISSSQMLKFSLTCFAISVVISF
jgi:hypothetical protein